MPRDAAAAGRRPRPRRSSRSGCGAGRRTSTPSIPSRTPASDYCGPLDKPIATNVDGHPDRRAAAAAGQAGRQVLDHPQHDPRHQRHETAAYMVQTGRKPGDRLVYPVRRRGGVAVQGLRPRLQGPDPAVHRADRAAGPVLRGGLPRASATSPSPPAATQPGSRSRSKASSPPGITDERQQQPPRAAAHARHAGPGHARRRRGSSGSTGARRRPTT